MIGKEEVEERRKDLKECGKSNELKMNGERLKEEKKERKKRRV